MSNRQQADDVALYEITVAGSLSPQWIDWFADFTMEQVAGDATRLTGPVVDQPALHGLLARIRDLSLPLLSVRRLSWPEP